MFVVERFEILGAPRIETTVETRDGVNLQSAGVWVAIQRDVVTANPALPLGVSIVVTQPIPEPDAVLVGSKIVDSTGSNGQELATLALGPATAFTSPARAFLSASAVGKTLTAQASISDSSAQFVATIDDSAGYVGLRTVRMAVAFDYVLVTDHVGQLPCP